MHLITVNSKVIKNKSTWEQRRTPAARLQRQPESRQEPNQDRLQLPVQKQHLQGNKSTIWVWFHVSQYLFTKNIKTNTSTCDGVTKERSHECTVQQVSWVKLVSRMRISQHFSPQLLRAVVLSNKHLETFKCVAVSAQLRFSGGQSHLSKSCSSALVNFIFLLQLKDLQSSLDLVLSSCQHFKTMFYLASKKSTYCFCRWGDVCLFFMNDTFVKIINGSGLLLEICWWFMFCLNASICTARPESGATNFYLAKQAVLEACWRVKYSRG